MARIRATAASIFSSAELMSASEIASTMHRASALIKSAKSCTLSNSIPAH